MASSSSSTFTIQPWAQDIKSNTDIRDVLSRAQRGHLRDITESSLQEELAAEGAVSLSDTSSTSDSEDETSDAEIDAKKQPVFGKPSTREDLYNAKRYMLGAIDAARNEVSISLDLMSLIVSKDAPRQAQATLGPHVKEKIPLGTLGLDYWQRMPTDHARETQDKLLAANVKMDNLQNAADGLLGAAKKMEENVRRETQYWDQILSISSRGWNVCRVPGQQHRLGVRYGFSESVAQFSRKGIAALNPDRDGGIYLERGVGSKPRALKVMLRKGGEIAGVSRVPAIPDADETTLETRIRYARDSVFDEELYHEMIRESRTLASLGVTVEESTVRLQHVTPDGEDDIEVSFDLVSLDEANDLESAAGESDSLAQATVLAARLLLSQAHRERLRKRSELPPPLSEKQKDDRPILPILRPLVALALHRSALAQMNGYLNLTAETLKAAEIECTTQKARFSFSEEKTPSTADALLANTLVRPLTSLASLSITPPPPSSAADSHPQPLTINITLETSLAHAFGPVYILQLPPSSADGDHGRKVHFFNFSSFASATSDALASLLTRAVLCLAQATAAEAEGEGGWQLRPNEAVLERDRGVGEDGEGFEVSFEAARGVLRLAPSAGGKVESWSGSKVGSGSNEKEEGEGKKGFWDAARARLQET